MASVRGGVSNSLLRLVAVMLVGLMANACSSIPSWVDPGTWLGPDVPDQASDNDNGGYPDLANIPEKPTQASTDEDQKKVADTLVAARNNVQYSAETLRGGTEASAAPPPAAPPPQAVAPAEESAPASPAVQEASPNPDDTASSDQPAAPANETANAPAPAPTEQVATAEEPPAAAQPAVPADSTERALPSVPASPATDAALGFQPSKAPPLDASVAQFVPQPIIARFAQTASVAPPAAPAVPDKDVKLKTPKGTRPSKLETGETDVGGPESMSGAVVADLGVLQAPTASETSVYTNSAGLPAAAVVFFPGDITSLNAEARQAVRSAVAAFRARGGQSYIRVVGHSSSRTANMPVLKHLEFIFKKSQDRASAVARELIHEGVPANRILINAVGDSQPVYYESMPKGEDGNRRTEIFIEG